MKEIKDYKLALEEAEKEIYLEAFKASRFNQSKTALWLGVSRGTLRKKLTKYLW